MFRMLVSIKFKTCSQTRLIRRSSLTHHLVYTFAFAYDFVISLKFTQKGYLSIISVRFET